MFESKLKDEFDKKSFASLPSDLKDYLNTHCDVVFGYIERTGYPNTQKAYAVCCWRSVAHGYVDGHVKNFNRVKWLSVLDEAADTYDCYMAIEFGNLGDQKIRHIDFKRFEK